MAVLVENKALCCGCMACANVCPKNAIKAQVDEQGFLYPQVDTALCVNCGLCERVCDFQLKQQAVHAPQKAYSLVHKEADVVKRSTSGGAFTALSDWILAQHGLVVGAAMDSDFTVYHHIAETAGQRDAMRGSLYVQSDIRDSFRAVRQALKEGRLVLFVGTPCQAAGLRSFLGKENDNLYVVEFLCHGVPNNDFLKAHIAWLESEYGKKAIGYSFRGKRYGWNHGIDEVMLENQRHADALKVQAYRDFFQKSVSLRPSCHNCSYRQWERAADLTIGDFWGIENLTGKQNYAGVSFILTNTEKGEALLKAVSDTATLQEYPLEKVRHRVSLKPSTSRIDPEKFWALYKEKGYAALVTRYHNLSFKKRSSFYLKKLGRRFAGGRKG